MHLNRAVGGLVFVFLLIFDCSVENSGLLSFYCICSKRCYWIFATNATVNSKINWLNKIARNMGIPFLVWGNNCIPVNTQFFSQIHGQFVGPACEVLLQCYFFLCFSNEIQQISLLRWYLTTRKMITKFYFKLHKH